MPLSLPQIKAAQPKTKDYKLSDEKGMYLLVKKNGAKYWRMKYRFDKKEKTLALGVFPETTLTMARNKRDAARLKLQQGIDPMAERNAKKTQAADAHKNAFSAITYEWLAKRGFKSKSTEDRLKRLLEKDLFPKLGNVPVNEITPPILLKELQRIEERGAIETAHRAKQYAGQIFRYAISTGRAEIDPSAALSNALTPTKHKHFAAITTPAEAGKLMLAIKHFQGTPVIHAALKLSALFFCRQGEVRHLEWENVNFEEKRIDIPADKMKMGEPHIIPLSKQALAILADLHTYHKRGKYVFPSVRGASQPISENGVRTALRTMGFDNNTMTPHGFRAMARTILDEVLDYRIDWIEHQLAHRVKDTHGRAYNRTKHMEGRRKMMQHWADYLEAITLQAETGNVITANFGKTS